MADGYHTNDLNSCISATANEMLTVIILPLSPINSFIEELNITNVIVHKQRNILFMQHF